MHLLVNELCEYQYALCTNKNLKKYRTSGVLKLFHFTYVSGNRDVPATLFLRKDTPFSIEYEVCGILGLSGFFGGRKIFLHLTGMECKFVGHPSRSPSLYQLQHSGC
jgi:hypothetical protein